MIEYDCSYMSSNLYDYDKPTTYVLTVDVNNGECKTHTQDCLASMARKDVREDEKQ